MQQMEINWVFHGIFALLASTCHFVLKHVEENVPNSYMDEIFHVPQVQVFCKGNFTHWDPMITTLPGLYMTVVGSFRTLDTILKIDLCSSIFYLRYINIIFCLLNFYTFVLISHHHLQQNENISTCKSKEMLQRIAVIEGFLVSVFPILFFFTFLFYTDQGGIGILYRQTNVVWVIFVAMNAALPVLTEHGNHSKSTDSLVSFVKNLKHLIKEAFSLNIKPLLKFVFQVLGIVWSYIIIVLLFVAFVAWNGSITVGAKEDHQACFHAVQIFYFCAFSTIFLLPNISILNYIYKFFSFLKKNKAFSFLIIFGIILVIHFTTKTHRYLLSDNRHYIFYIWKNFFRKHWFLKYSYAPLYFFCLFCIWKSVSCCLWKLVFFFGVSFTLIPSPLFELRYFITPYIFLRFNIKRNASILSLLLELAGHISINFITIYIFLYKPFTWSGSTEAQRFMY